jgi:hypothetical protein
MVFLCFISFVLALLSEVGQKRYTFQVRINTWKSHRNVSYYRSLHWTRHHLDSSNIYKKNHSLLQIIKHLFPKGIWHSMTYITISKPLWTYNRTGPLNRYNCWTFHIASSIHCHTSHTTRTSVSSLTCSLQFSSHWRTVMNILKSSMVPYIAALLQRNNKMHFTQSHPHYTLLPFVVHAYSHLYIMVYKKHYNVKMHTTSNME